MDVFLTGKVSSYLYTEEFANSNTFYHRIQPNFMSQRAKEKLEYHKLKRIGLCECDAQDAFLLYTYTTAPFCTLIFKYQQNQHIVLIEDLDKQGTYTFAVVYPDLATRQVANSLEDFIVFATYYPDWILNTHPDIDALPCAGSRELFSLTGKSDAEWRALMKQMEALPLKIKFKQHTQK